VLSPSSVYPRVFAASIRVDAWDARRGSVTYVRRTLASHVA
jgi:hypothetical protein